MVGCSATRSIVPGNVHSPANVRDASFPEVAPGSTDLQRRVAELEEALRRKEQELQQVRAELARAQSGTVDVSLGGHGSTLGHGQSIQSLQQELAAERARREALVRELEELRREVASPFGENHVLEAEYLALKQELVELRRRLDAFERDRRALLEASPAAAREQRPPTADMLAAEQQRLASDLQADLQASQLRVGQLEAQLASIKEQAERSATLESENSRLRAQLAEERRRAEALEAKLKVAARVTELIFRMRPENRAGQRRAAPE